MTKHEFPTEEEIIDHANLIKTYIKATKIEDKEFKRILLNQMSKLLRMLKKPVRRVYFKTEVRSSKFGGSIIRRKDRNTKHS